MLSAARAGVLGSGIGVVRSTLPGRPYLQGRQSRIHPRCVAIRRSRLGMIMPRPTESRRGNTVPEADVAAMFDAIAPVYDRVNTVMTAGGDGRWRRAAVRAAEVSSAMPSSTSPAGRAS